MKNIFRKSLVLLAVIGALATMLMLSASAADNTLYTQGDIEWTIDTATGVVTVHPTATATGKAHFEDLNAGAWNEFCKTTYTNVITKVVIENVEGRAPITTITGGFVGGNQFTTIVFPKTVTAIGARNGGWAFSGKGLTTIGPEGTPEGTCDLSQITAPWGGNHANMFNNIFCSNIILPNIAASIPSCMFRGVPNLIEVAIPENTTSIPQSAFLKCSALSKVTIKGANTNVSPYAFEECTNMFTIVGHKDSTAYECAKENGYEFIDITTGNVILKGTIEIGRDPTEPVNGVWTQGNIEWTFDEKTGVVTVHPTKKATGTAHFEDLGDGAWKKFCKETYTTAIKKVVIENVEGRAPITTITGGFVGGNQFTTIVFPKTVTAIGRREGGWAFSATGLTTIGPEGTPAGTCDFSQITTAWGGNHSNMFNGISCSTYILPNIESTIVANMFRGGSKLKELTIPANVTSIVSSAFNGCKGLNKVTVSNAATKVALDAFVSCTRMFTIVGHSGSSAYECAKKNGYEFIDIGTGKKLLEGTVELGIDPDIVFPWTRETADDCGTLYQEYNGKPLIDTFWAWYEKDKTIVFYDNKPSGYNEIGAQTAVSDSGTHWMDYKDVVEKVVIESGIDKVTGGAFKDFTNLKYVQLGGQGELDGNAFLNCTGLVSIYKAYDFPQEGVADLTSFKIINAGVLRNTGIHTVIIKDGIEKVNASGLYGVKNIISEPTEYLIGFCKDNGFNLISSKDPNVVYEYYRYIDAANIIQAGTNAMCSFDAETGVLTVFGEGETYDISNYYGGGSKKQPWFQFRKEIKKIVFGPKINKIGKYSFAQCVNLEVIELPDAPVEISNAAFEKCYNLKSVYRAGGEPIEGVFDLSKASALNSWGFAYNYLVVNPIISEEIIEMDSTLFEDCMNIANIYGVPGSYAESFAAELGKTFVDISTGMPAAATATPPEMNQDEKERAERDAEKTAENTEPLFTDPVFVDGPVTPDTGKTPAGSTDNGGSMTTVFIIAVVAVVVVAAAVVAVIVLKKKKKA